MMGYAFFSIVSSPDEDIRMQRIHVQFCWLDASSTQDLNLPSYQSDLASGMDVSAAVEIPLMVEPGSIVMVPTGFSVAIPAGYEIQVRPRSGLAIKKGVTVVNAPGTIDADYRGEVKIGLINLGKDYFIVRRGDRIAQLVLAPVYKAVLDVVVALDTTTRGQGGFGHTGI